MIAIAISGLVIVKLVDAWYTCDIPTRFNKRVVEKRKRRIN